MEPSSPLPTTMALPPPAPAVTRTEPLEELKAGVVFDGATTNPPAEADPCEDRNTSATLSVKPTSLFSGYLWKFPSEGSVETAGHAQREDESYPRRCQRCGVCWVSDAANETAHKRVCRSSTHLSNKRLDEGGSTAKLGPARRVFCEVDGRQTTLQWRFDGESEDWSDSVSLPSIRKASVMPDLPNAFTILTTDSRHLVFQIRREISETSNEVHDDSGMCDAGQQVTEYPDATQWCELLGCLCDLKPPEVMQTVSSDQEDDTISGDHEELSPAAVNMELASEICQLISDGDVDSLDRMLCLELGGPLEAPRRDLVDVGGNSLLLLTLKLCREDALPEMIARVVQFSVDPNLANHELETPLLIAAASGNAEVVHQLLETEDINVNLVGALGVTPLHVAANSGEMAIVELLCQYGADPYAVDENGWTALHYAAACSGGLAAIHFLCELMPELIDSQCSEGNTALHVAAACGCVENVRALLETAASPAIMNAGGQTPYRLALQNNKIQCALAINEYQQSQHEPLGNDNEYKSYTLEGGEQIESYAVVGASVSPLDDWNVIGEAEVPEKTEETIAEASGDWIECKTEGGLPYYYNTVTGVSSWFKFTASAPSSSEFWGCEADFKAEALSLYTSAPFSEHTIAAPGRSGTELGQELPLCLIPMVSPLTSLDDPTAASKLAAQRQKARENRRKRFGKQRRGRSVNR